MLGWKRDQRTFNTFGICNLTLKYKSNFCFSYSFFIIVINVPPMRWWPSIYRFQLFKPFPLTTYRLSTLFPFIVEKRKAGWRMFRKMQQIYILTKRTISFQHVWLNCALQLISNPRKIYDYLSTFQNNISKLKGITKVIIIHYAI